MQNPNTNQQQQPSSTCQRDEAQSNNSRRAVSTVDITKKNPKINPPEEYDPMSILKREQRWEQIFDIDGSLWDVREARATKHGFDLLFGRPANSRLPQNGGPSRLIATPALVHFWETHRTNIGYAYDLPAGRTTIKRVRSRLKLNLVEDRRKLWKKRATDLKTLATNEFAERYNVSTTMANDWRFHMFGRTTRPLNWWQHPAALAILLNKDLKLKEVGQALQIGTSHANRLRARAAQVDSTLLEKQIDTPIPTPLFHRPKRFFIRSPFFRGNRQGELFGGQEEFWRPFTKPAAPQPEPTAQAVNEAPKPRLGKKHSHSIATAVRTRQMLLPFKQRRGPEPKPILFQVQDHQGTFYDVFDSRPTNHGFNLLFGFPTRMHRRLFTNFGKPGLIATPELVAFWEKHRGEIKINLDLPAGHTTLIRARMKLGFNQFEDYKATWVERIPDLQSLPVAEVAKKYNVEVGTVYSWRRTLLGDGRSPQAQLPLQPKRAA